MKLKMRIGGKLMLLVITTSASIILTIGLFIGLRINSIAQEDAVKVAQAEAKKSANEIKAGLELDLGFARAFAYSLEIYANYDSSQIDGLVLDIIKSLVINNRQYLTIYHSVEFTAYKPNYPLDYGRRSITVYMQDGKPKWDIEYKNVTGDNTASSYYFSKSRNCEKLVDPYKFDFGGNEVLATSISVPFSKNGKFAGIGGVDIALDHFQEIIEKVEPYRGTTSALIGSSGVVIAHTNPEYSQQNFAELYPLENSKYKLDDCFKNGKSITYYSTTNNQDYLCIITPINVGNSPIVWSMFISIPMNEILVDANKGVLYTVLVIIIGVILLSLAIWRISRYITKPIMKTTQVLNALAEGDIDINKKIILQTGDELEDMAHSANRMIDGLNLTEHFAREIEGGNLDAHYTQLGEKDTLGKALIAMRDSLVVARSVEKSHKEETELQNWITQGIAKFSEILRQHNDNIEELSYLIIKNLVSYTDSIQGGVFIVNDNDPTNLVIEMTACYAYDRRKYLQKTILPNEGLVGRCYVEQKTIFMRQVPQSYIKVTSGLGEENPSRILIVPLKTSSSTLGVIELASFNEYTKHQVEFIEKIAANIAITLSTVKANIRTSQLLTQTQQQAEEMRAQEEEMRQNMEELHATQEEMERKRFEQDNIQRQLLEDKSILYALLGNSQDYIFQKDTMGCYVKVSHSMLRFFNVDSVDEVIGQTDFDLLSAEEAQVLSDLDSEVNRTHQSIINRDVPISTDSIIKHSSLSLHPLIEENGEYIGTLGIIKVG